ncbi:MAG: PilZ domain-containing protein [Parahaliea sp.]
MSGLIYRDHFGVRWHYAQVPTERDHLDRISISNEQLLRLLSATGEVSTGGKELEDAGSGTSQELQKLDLKINLLLDLVSTLIYRDGSIPLPSLAEVSASGVRWCPEGAPGPEPGTTVFLEVYIQRGLPKPLCWYAQVETCGLLGEREAVSARFLGMAGPAAQALEKWLFRQHRRQVASARSRSAS